MAAVSMLAPLCAATVLAAEHASAPVTPTEMPVAERVTPTENLAVERAVARMHRGDIIEPALLEQLRDSADGLLLRAWLLAEGRYGVDASLALAREGFQSAAEQGQVAALQWCGQGCITLTPAVRQTLNNAIAQGHAAALYLQSRMSLEAGDAVSADRFLVAAARKRFPQALDALYIDYFLAWSRGVRSAHEAEEKLQRCASEGLVSCYHLLASFYLRHHDVPQALHYALALRWLDAGVYQQFFGRTHIARLIEQLPQQNIEPIRSRVAVQLSRLGSAADPRLNRFGHCARQADILCVEQVATRDRACMLQPFADSYLKTLRDSEGYRACISAGPVGTAEVK